MTGRVKSSVIETTNIKWVSYYYHWFLAYFSVGYIKVFVESYVKTAVRQGNMCGHMYKSHAGKIEDFFEKILYYMNHLFAINPLGLSW